MQDHGRGNENTSCFFGVASTLRDGAVTQHWLTGKGCWGKLTLCDKQSIHKFFFFAPFLQQKRQQICVPIAGWREHAARAGQCQ